MDVFGYGREESLIRDLINKFNNNRIRLLGSVENKILIEKMNNYNIFISTSEIEGSPKALLEAMGAGLLIIAMRCQGNNELIENGINGFIFENSNQLKEIIKKIRSLNENQIKSIINSNYNKVKIQHSLQSHSKNEIGLANDLLKK